MSAPIASPIAPEYRRRAPRWIAEARQILAAHRPDDEPMRRFAAGRDALGRATGSAR